MLVLDLRFSWLGFGFLAGSHLAALLSLWQISLPSPLLAVMAVLIVLSLLHLCRSWLPHGARKPDALRLGNEQCALSYQAREVATELPRIHYFSEYLLVLRLQPLPQQWGPIEQEIWLVLYPDSLSRDHDRRLRRYLRFGCQLC